MFRVGQQVECVSDFSYAKRYGVSIPSKGKIYTVREIVTEGAEPGLRIFGVVNPAMKHWNFPVPIEPAFPFTGFRPLVTHSTESGVALLREIADKVTRKGRVDA